jgi:hypothetical protein
MRIDASLMKAAFLHRDYESESVSPELAHFSDMAGLAEDGLIPKYQSSIPSRGRTFRKYYRGTSVSNGCCAHLSAHGGVAIAA